MFVKDSLPFPINHFLGQKPNRRRNILHRLVAVSEHLYFIGMVKVDFLCCREIYLSWRPISEVFQVRYSHFAQPRDKCHVICDKANFSEITSAHRISVSGILEKGKVQASMIKQRVLEVMESISRDSHLILSI